MGFKLPRLSSCRFDPGQRYSTGSSSVWDERLIWVQEAAGSSPVYPILLADMAELADAIDLGSIGVPCGFKSHYPHFKQP